MKLFHIIVALHPVGGAELMMVRLARHQRAHQGFEPVVVTLGDAGALGDALRADGFDVLSLGAGGLGGAIRAVWRLARTIAREKPRIVQTWMYHADLVGGLAARLAGNRNLIWGIRNTDLFPGRGVSRSLGAVVKLCARLSSRLPSAIVCVAESARESHVRMGYAPEKMVVVPNGFVVPELPGADARRQARSDLGLPADALLVGSVGRFNAYKDPQSFVRAMGKVADAVPQARFVMVGRDLDAGNPDLAEWIRETGCRDRFFLLGHRSDVARCYAAFDCFCLHSKSEGFPNVLAEAMLAGVPSVSTDVGDARAMSGGFVEMVPPGDPAALAEAVIGLCTLSDAQRAARGADSRRHIEDHYSLDAVAERYAALYRTILDRGEVGPV
jgi:glycosyltransferase involved in cell wall biosynthesis